MIRFYFLTIEYFHSTWQMNLILVGAYKMIISFLEWFEEKIQPWIKQTKEWLKPQKIDSS